MKPIHIKFLLELGNHGFGKSVNVTDFFKKHYKEPENKTKKTLEPIILEIKQWLDDLEYRRFIKYDSGSDIFDNKSPLNDIINQNSWFGNIEINATIKSKGLDYL